MDLSQLGNSIKQTVRDLHQDDPDALLIAFLPTESALDYFYEHFETNEHDFFNHEGLVEILVYMHIFEKPPVLGDLLQTNSEGQAQFPITFTDLHDVYHIATIDDIDAELIEEDDHIIFYSLDGILSTYSFNAKITKILKSENQSLSKIFNASIIDSVVFDRYKIYGLAYITTMNNRWTYAKGCLAYLLGIRYTVIADDSDDFDLSMGLFTLVDDEPDEIVRSVSINPEDLRLIGSDGTHGLHIEVSGISSEINHPYFEFEV